MNAETIKRIVDDERVERLTAQLCRHWDVATERLEELVQDQNEGMDTCAEAEIYAALMRMQSAIMAFDGTEQAALYLPVYGISRAHC